MTDSTPRATDARSLDVELARLLGWTDVVPDAYTPNGRDACGTPPTGVTPMWSTGRSVIPHYSTDIAVAYALEDELVRRGLESRYVSCLMDILEQEYDEHHLNLTMFSYIHATPEQRAAAARAAVEGEQV